MVDPNYVPINIFSKELKVSPSTDSLLDENQHDTEEEVIILAELEHRTNSCSNSPKEAESATPSDNGLNSSPAVSSSAEHHKDTSSEAEHEKSMPETRDQLSLQNSPVSGMRDVADNGSRPRELEMSTSPMQSGACINPLGDCISEEGMHTAMLTHTECSLATSHISNNDTPTHVSVDNTVPYQMEHTASPSTTSDDFTTEGNILSSCSSEQSPITPAETSFMATIPTMPASDTDTHEPNTLPLPSPLSPYVQWKQ